MSPVGQPLKYYPLQRFLEVATADTVTLTFAQVEAIIGTPLPAGAQAYTWWSNRQRSRQARAWLAAGWQTRDVESRQQRVTFVRVEQSHGTPTS
jgi:hypothetical protein